MKRPLRTPLDGHTLCHTFRLCRVVYENVALELGNGGTQVQTENLFRKGINDNNKTSLKLNGTITMPLDSNDNLHGSYESRLNGHKLK